MTTAFDPVINRRHTGSVKWDFMAEKLGLDGDDLLPMWVSDYDFQCPPTVLQALHQRVEHGVFGYAERDAAYYQAIIDWYRTQHHVEIEKDWITTVHGILPGLAVLLEVLTEPGDKVVMQTPGYGAFRKITELNKRVLLENPLLEHAGTYTLDLAQLEMCFQQGAKVLLFCNPHNPTGKAWSTDDIFAVAQLCHQYQVWLFSDEIWGDLNMPGHQCHSALSLPSAITQRLIVATASSKTFGLSSLRISNLMIPNAELKQQFIRRLDAHGMDVFNSLSMCAATAAYQTAADWLAELKQYLQHNVDLLADYLKQHLPQLHFTAPEAGYLAWIDCRALAISDHELEQKLVHAGLVASMGIGFGKQGSGFIRLNLGCPQETLKKALHMLSNALA